jgi:cytochrome c oxidase subunit 2
MILFGIIASAIGTALTLWMDWFPTPAAESSDDIDTLYDVLLIFSVPIFILVMTIAIYSVWKFRARPGDMRDGAPIHGNTRLEVVWVTIPFLIVSGLAVYSWIVLDDIEAKAQNEMTVNVTGQQFTWTFEYPQGQGGDPVRAKELVLPKDQPVIFKIKTADVIHSFWVPQFRLKSDAVPGITTQVRLTPNREGTYRVVCTELCGLGHATMRQNVRVVPRAEFDSWLRELQAGGGGGGGGEAGEEEGGGAAAQGEQIFTANGCGGCHTFTDAGTQSEVGPNLDELAKAAGEREEGKSPEDYVREAITDPNAFVTEGFQQGIMPQDYEQQLSPEEIDALVEYLLTVSEGSGGKAE